MDVGTPGGSSLIFVYGCEILRFETPPLSKTHQRRKLYPFASQIYEELIRKCPKTYDLVHLRKFFDLTLAKD